MSAHSAKTNYGSLLVMDRAGQFPEFSLIWPGVTHTKVKILVFLDVSEKFNFFRGEEKIT